MATAPIISKKRQAAPTARSKRPLERGKKITVTNPVVAYAALSKESILKNSDTSFLVDLKNSIRHQLAKPIIAEYIETIKRKKLDLLKFAYKFNGDKIDVWIEIKDRDDKTRNKLYDLDAKINNRHYPATEIFLDSFILEARHYGVVPSEYYSVNLK